MNKDKQKKKILDNLYKEAVTYGYPDYKSDVVDQTLIALNKLNKVRVDKKELMRIIFNISVEMIGKVPFGYTKRLTNTIAQRINEIIK